MFYGVLMAGDEGSDQHRQDFKVVLNNVLLSNPWLSKSPIHDSAVSYMEALTNVLLYIFEFSHKFLISGC